jgi:enoyl-CoA hydratase/carnithine racemase
MPDMWRRWEEVMSKHTPGPWAVEQGERPHTGYTVITARHAGMTPRSPLALIGNVIGADEAEPDARLISAAPEMLEALQTAVAWAQKAADFNDADNVKGNVMKAHKIMMALAGYIPKYSKDIDDMHAAIKKATGQ